MVGKTIGFLALMAVLAVSLFPGTAQAGESNFLNTGSPLASGSLVEARGSVGVSAGGESDEERRRLAARPGGSLSGVTSPLPRNGALPATRSVSRATDFQAAPALVSAVRNELNSLGLK